MPIIRPWIALLCLFACGQVELAPSSELKKRDYEDFEDECFETILAIAKEENTEVTEEEILEICSSTDNRDLKRAVVKRSLRSSRSIYEDECRAYILKLAEEEGEEVSENEILETCADLLSTCREFLIAFAKDRSVEVTESDILEACSFEDGDSDYWSEEKRDEMRKAIKRNLISKKDVDEDICRESVVETAKELNIELTTEQITAYCSSEELIDEDTRDEKLAAIKRSLMSKKDNDENEGDNDDDGDSDDDFDCASFVLALAEAENVELTSVEADDICKSDDDFEDEDEKREAIKRSLLSKKDEVDDACRSFALAIAKQYNVELDEDDLFEICSEVASFEDVEKRNAVERKVLSRRGNNLSSLHETIKRSLDQFLPLVKRGLQALRRR